MADRFNVVVPGVVVSDGVGRVEQGANSAMVKIAAQLERLVRSERYELGSQVEVVTGKFCMNLSPKSTLSRRLDGDTRTILEVIAEHYNHTLNKFETAAKENRAEHKTRVDRAILRLNKLFFGVHGRKESFVPGFSANPAIQLRIVDPKLLDCPTPGKPTTVEITNAPIIGAFEVLARQRDAIDEAAGHIVVVIVIDNDPHQIVYRCTRDVAQSLWRSNRKLSCTAVAGRGGRYEATEIVLS